MNPTPQPPQRRNPRGLTAVSSAASSRIRSAAHRAAILFENDQTTKHLVKLRELMQNGASLEEIEKFVAGVEARSGF